jgi:hypothetical protein
VVAEALQRLRIDGVAYLLGAGGGRVNLKAVGLASLGSQLFEDKLGHHTAADIAMTDKEYLMHTFCYSKMQKYEKKTYFCILILCTSKHTFL